MQFLSDDGGPFRRQRSNGRVYGREAASAHYAAVGVDETVRRAAVSVPRGLLLVGAWSLRRTVRILRLPPRVSLYKFD